MTPIKALANADEAIRVLAQEGEMSPAALAERLDMPRPSVYRLLDGLSAIGLTEPIAGSMTRLSLRWLHLADRARESIREWHGAHEQLAALVDATGQTAFLSVPRGDEAVCLEWEQGRGIGVLVLRPGGTLPLYAGAAGRVLLAFATDVDAYLRRVERRRLTERTMVEEDELHSDVELTRETGHVVSDGDVTDGIAAIGVPVRDGSGAVIAALSLAGLAAELVGSVDAFAPLLHETAERLGALGG